jgi:hypothetical protein
MTEIAVRHARRNIRKIYSLSSFNGLLLDRKAQSAVWGLLAILVLVAIGGGLVDIYRLYAARNWAYSVAQEAAMAGASRGRDWSSVTGGGAIRLVSATAQSEAQRLVATEMSNRGVSQYVVDVRVLSSPTGGSITGYPPNPVRMGTGLGNWSSSEPAVGVYLEVPVSWLMLDMLGNLPKTVRVFASAGVAQ